MDERTVYEKLCLPCPWESLCEETNTHCEDYEDMLEEEEPFDRDEDILPFEEW